MKQIHKAVHALENDIGFWRLSWILLKKLKIAKKIYRANFLGSICILQIFRNNQSRVVWLYYQILMMAKMSKTEISAKILKRKKIKAVRALACAIGFWRPSWILLKRLKTQKKITRQIPQGQYAYYKYLEIIWVGVFEWEQKQVAGAGGLSKNNQSPPPHYSGWRLNYYRPHVGHFILNT